ncbi:transferrin receptor-like dimerization domain-containing protein [soil metagenome]
MTNRPLFPLAWVAAALLALPALAAAQQQPIRGFPSAAVGGQHEREARMRQVPNPDTLRDQMLLLSQEPHEAGTDRSRRVAELILERFRSYGLEARIEQFEALMPRPVSRTLELVAPERYTAKLQEPPMPEDRFSDNPNQLPTYNAYSADGDVTAELVFVNYGTPEDYRVLDSLGIDVRGKIVIAKYGRSWRGIKPKVAAERGAVGALIYSDPRDDGYWGGDIYPEGPMRPWGGVQRGSVMDMPTHPGDPLSPGWASERGSRRLPVSQARTIMSIPVLPISYEDALPLLRNLGGPVAPESWRGALPITYKIGAGPAVVRLALQFDWQTRPLYNVIARIPGARSPDQWVIHGNHHDAWNNGAMDPISGMVALGEAARAMGALLRTGWRPARTIIFAAWDGEEWGLLGSTEWAEKHARELREKTVVYLNSDSNDRGWIGVGGSHSLEEFTREVARDVQDPQRGMSVLDAWKARQEERRAAPTRPATPQPVTPDSANLDLPGRVLARADTAAAVPLQIDTLWTISALGSGSDYTAFLDHLALPALNISYGGESPSGIYHSIYDSFDFYRRFADTTFLYGVAEAQTMGTAILRLADAPVLPFEFTRVVRTYRKYADEIETEAGKQDATRALELSGVRASLDRLEQAAERYESALAALERLPEAEVQRRWRQLAAVNKTLYQTEQALSDPAGLPQREWFRHLLYAPGFYTGYGVKTMPGIREAVEDRPDAAVAQAQAARVTAALDRYAAQVNRAAEGLERALR